LDGEYLPMAATHLLTQVQATVRHGKVEHYERRDYVMRRTRGLTAVMLCIGLVACVLAGCFGGDPEPAVTTSAVTVPSSSTTTSGVTTTTQTSTLVDGLPSEYVASLGKKPILVLFYVTGQVDDEKVLSAVRELRGSFSSYTFLTYDYRFPAAYGDLSQKLKIDSPPAIVVFDRNGVQRTGWSGYVGKAALNQSLINLGRY
jgi:hypothetical protein